MTSAGKRVFPRQRRVRTTSLWHCSDFVQAQHHSMSSPLDVKRRKLNNAANTLAKPFVSPMRNVKAERQPLKDTINTTTPYRPSILAHTIQSTYPTHVESPSAKLAATSATPVRRPRTIIPTTTNKRRTDPAELAAQKELSRLEARIRAAKTDIDILEQAHQITNSATDDELAALAEKWRLASQQAAEELFGTVKERVCRMGGVAAWRESEKQKFERASKSAFCGWGCVRIWC